MKPVNVPFEVHSVIMSGKATYSELSSTLSIRDMYNILESIAVQNYNETVIQRHSEGLR